MNSLKVVLSGKIFICQQNTGVYKITSVWDSQNYPLPAIMRVYKQVGKTSVKRSRISLLREYALHGRDYNNAMKHYNKFIANVICQYIAIHGLRKLLIQHRKNLETYNGDAYNVSRNGYGFPMWMTYTYKRPQQRYRVDHVASRTTGRLVHLERDGQLVPYGIAYNDSFDDEAINKWRPHCRVCNVKECIFPCKLGDQANAIEDIKAALARPLVNGPALEWANRIRPMLEIERRA